MRELSGVGHQHGVRLFGQDRRDDDAGVGDDRHAGPLQRLASAGAVEFGKRVAAGAGIKWDAQLAPGNQPLQRIELGERQMRAADRDRVELV